MLPRYLVKKFYFIWKPKETFGLANSIISKTKLGLISNTKVPIIHPSDKWLLSESWARRSGSGPWGTETKPLRPGAVRWEQLESVGHTQKLAALCLFYKGGASQCSQNKPFLPTLKTPKISTKIIISISQGKKGHIWTYRVGAEAASLTGRNPCSHVPTPLRPVLPLTMACFLRPHSMCLARW